MPALEPTLEALGRSPLRYVLATRPPFLLAAAVPVLLGIAWGAHTGHGINGGIALLAVVAAVLLHAGVNVLNDYHDDRIGTDAINTDRIFPFTGGSRFIQNGILSSDETLRLGLSLWGITALLGVVLASLSGPWLYGLGLLGLFIGWAYSAPPLSLNSHGLGEPCVAVGFGLLPVGAFYTQTGGFDAALLPAALAFGLLTTNLLYINQFPDLRADAATGKHNWVVRLGAQRARYGYPLIAATAFGIHTVGVVAGSLPAATLTALLTAIPAVFAARRLIRDAAIPSRLAPAIRLTILAVLGYGLLTSLALVLG